MTLSFFISLDAVMHASSSVLQIKAKSAEGTNRFGRNCFALREEIARDVALKKT